MTASSPKAAASRSDDSPQRAARRHDPERRERIIEAALTVIAENGVAGTSMRLIAREADVPLGSMTYHFKDREELLSEAMQRCLSELEEMTLPRLRAAECAEEALDVVADYLCWPVNRRLLLLTYELYAYSARNEQMKSMLAGSHSCMRSELMRFFSKPVAAALSALIDGAYIHRAYDAQPPSKQEFLSVIAQLVR